MHVLIVGGGVFGVTAAIELARRGHQVDLVDADALPAPFASSTDTNKIIRSDYGTDEFWMELADQAIEQWHAWNAGLFVRYRDVIEAYGIHNNTSLYQEVGVLLLKRRPMEAGDFEYESFERMKAKGVPVKRLDKSSIAAYRFLDSNIYVDGYLNPRGGYARSGAVMAVLTQVARDAGVSVHTNHKVTSVIYENAGASSPGSLGRAVGVRTEKNVEFRGDVVVVATGAWTPFLVPQMRRVLTPSGQPVVHIRCDSLPRSLPFDPKALPVWAADLSETGFYGFPAMPDGILKMGNHMPQGLPFEGQSQPTLSKQIEPVFQQFLLESIPSLAGIEFESTRMCLYTDSWDSSFYITYVPFAENLFVASGGSGHGFKFAPVLGAIVADAIERKEGPYSRQFQWREPLAAAERRDSCRPVVLNQTQQELLLRASL